MILKGNAAEEKKIFSKSKSRDLSLKGTRLLGVTSCFVLMGDQILKAKLNDLNLKISRTGPARFNENFDP